MAASSAPPIDTATGRSQKFVALALAVGWVAALAILTLVSANPVTLNREQIARSPVVVTALVEEAAGGRCRVERAWRPETIDGEIVVSNLAETRAESGGRYILPLEPDQAGGYAVVPARLPRNPYLVYPANESAQAQLEQILAAQSADSGRLRGGTPVR